MKTQILKLLLMLMPIMALCSCEKKEMPWEKAQRNVELTEWVAVGEDDTCYELSFVNGKYFLKYTYDGDALMARGTYKQTGNKIKFEKKEMITYGIFFMEEGTISSTGEIKVPLYQSCYLSDRLYKYDIKFILKF